MTLFKNILTLFISAFQRFLFLLLFFKEWLLFVFKSFFFLILADFIFLSKSFIYYLLMFKKNFLFKNFFLFFYFVYPLYFFVKFFILGYVFVLRYLSLVLLWITLLKPSSVTQLSRAFLFLLQHLYTVLSFYLKFYNLFKQGLLSFIFKLVKALFASFLYFFIYEFIPFLLLPLVTFWGFIWDKYKDLEDTYIYKVHRPVKSFIFRFFWKFWINIAYFYNYWASAVLKFIFSFPSYIGRTFLPLFLNYLLVYLIILLFNLLYYFFYLIYFLFNYILFFFIQSLNIFLFIFYYIAYIWYICIYYIINFFFFFFIFIPVFLLKLFSTFFNFNRLRLYFNLLKLDFKSIFIFLKLI